MKIEVTYFLNFRKVNLQKLRWLSILENSLFGNLGENRTQWEKKKNSKSMYIVSVKQNNILYLFTFKKKKLVILIIKKKW